MSWARREHPRRMLKKAGLLTRPTPVRRDAPCPMQGRSEQDFFSILLFRHEDQHPRRAFFDHVRKTSSGTAGGNPWKDGSTANLNGSETIGSVLCGEKGKDAWNLP